MTILSYEEYHERYNQLVAKRNVNAIIEFERNYGYMLADPIFEKEKA